MSSTQAEIVKPLTLKAITEPRLICILPENKTFQETFQKIDGQFVYTTKFLAPSKVGEFSAKFKTIMNCIDRGRGIVFVYSNIVEQGAQLFSMCLEEHGFQPAIGNALLKETSNEIKRGSRGRYVLFTSETGDVDIKRALVRLRRPENIDGDDIRVIVASPKVSEGVDFKYVRQIHVLDPWFNMSRIEQVIGRGMRTCSHALLPFEHQNCTVYLHVCSFEDDASVTLDESIYRTIVEPKAIRIAKIKHILMESAMDCSLEKPVNVLPLEWANLNVEQIRSYDNKPVTLKLKQMVAPTFLQTDDDVFVCDTETNVSVAEPDRIRPLSSILDVKDEVFDRLIEMFQRKAVWTQSDVINELKPLSSDVVNYIIQHGIQNDFQLRDQHNRVGYLETKKGLFAFRRGLHETLMDRVLPTVQTKSVSLPEETRDMDNEAIIPQALDMSKYTWPDYADGFSSDVKTWFYVDHMLKGDDRIGHFMSLNWNTPPVYAAPLKIEVGGRTLIVMGSGILYDVATKKQIGEPIGAEADAYKAWVTRLKDAFVASKDDYFATMIDGILAFNIDDKSEDMLKRAERSKKIGGRKCTSYYTSILKLFVEWLGDAFSNPGKMTKEDRCGFIDLVIRRAILEKKDGIRWWTPEEWDVLKEPTTHKELLKRLK